MLTDGEREELTDYERELRMDNLRADTELKRALRISEAWKTGAALLGAGAAFGAALASGIIWVFQHTH